MPIFKPGDNVCGRFTVEKLVGTGGMSEVYRGRDSKLSDRLVAIKVLRPQQVVSPETHIHVLTEIRSLSKLNHPHIATLYDVCTHQDSDVLVMEFLEGSTLEGLLVKGPLREMDALRYAGEIASALSYAHRCGVIHRDIKPGNIAITPQGAKLLDFGIAKRIRQSEAAGEGQVDETEIMDSAIVGTPSYMSPEQRTDGALDHRTDIYSFGLVLAQMLAGAPKPVLPDMIDRIASRPLRRIVKKCIESDPKERWFSANDLASALAAISESIETKVETPSEPPPKRLRFAVLLGMTALLIAAIVWATYPWSSNTVTPQVEFQILPPPEYHLISLETGGPPAISPNGKTVAFVAAQDKTQEAVIWLRALNSAAPTLLRGSEGAAHPFWSPDGGSLAFFSHGKLKRINLPNGPPTDLCDALNGRGGSWSKDQVIVFTPDFTEALYSVPAEGGQRTKITEAKFLSGETSHRWPFFLPDGRRFLFFVRSDLPEVQGLYLGSLDTRTTTLVVNIGSSAVYARAPGTDDAYLLYTDGGYLFAKRIVESSDVLVTGESSRILQLPQPQEDTSVVPVSVSGDGILVYAGGSVYRQALQWVGRNGTESAFGALGQFRNPRLSPDGRKIVVEKLEIRTGFASLWLFDLDRNTQNPLEQFSRAAFNPVWSPDGRSLLYAAFDGLWHLTRRDATYETAPELLRRGGIQVPTDWSSKGWIIYQEKGDTKEDQWDLVALDFAKRTTKTLLATPKNERQGRLSPDGSWLAYTSNEFRADQVYIAHFPDMAPRLPVSEEKGTQPVWSSDGSELYYISQDRDLMRVSVNLKTSPPTLGKPERLFTVDMARASGFTAPVNYDVDSRGKRFLIAGPPQIQNLHQQIAVRLNWMAPSPDSK